MCVGLPTNAFGSQREDITILSSLSFSRMTPLKRLNRYEDA